MDYETRGALRLVLDFIEDNNKQDANREVAQAAEELNMWLAHYTNKVVSES